MKLQISGKKCENIDYIYIKMYQLGEGIYIFCSNMKFESLKVHSVKFIHSVKIKFYLTTFLNVIIL